MSSPGGRGRRRGRQGRVVLAVMVCGSAVALLGAECQPPTQPPGAVASVEVTPSLDTLKALGLTRQLAATAKDAQGNVISGKTFAWASSPTSVATVDASGVVTAVANGTATVTATTDGVSGSAGIAVRQTAATVTVTPATATLTAIGDTLRLVAAVKDSKGSTVAGATVIWTSAATSVARVSTAGLVTAAGNGTAVITAAAEGVSGTASLTVAQRGTRLGIRTQPSGAAVGAVFVTQPLIEVRDANGNVVVNDNSTTVTAALSQGTATLGGTLSVRAVSGVATFTDLRITGNTGNYSLGFSATGLTSVTSGLFPLSSGAIASITVTPSGHSFVSLGDTVRFAAAATDVGGNGVTGVQFTWTSGDSLIARVNATGLVTARANGSVTIAANAQNVTGAAAVGILQRSARLAIRRQPSGAAVGAPFVTQPVIEVQDANGNVAVIDSSTAVTAALAAGSGTLSGTLSAAAVGGVATFVNLQIVGTTGNYTLDFASSGLTSVRSGAFPVSPGAVAVIAITPEADTLDALGDTTRFAATAWDVSGNPRPDARFSWRSKDSAVARVDTTGLATARGNGVAVIAATAENVTDSARIRVAQRVVRVSLSPSRDTLRLTGATRQLSGTAFDANDSAAAQVRWLWVSSNHNVAVVDSTGLVRAVDEGTATISAAAQGVPGHAVVVVNIPVASVEVSPDSPVLSIGDTLRLSAVVKDSGGAVLQGRAVTWSSLAPAAATVNANGLVSALGPGLAMVVAQAEGKADTAAVTVGGATEEFPIMVGAADMASLDASFDGTNFLPAAGDLSHDSAQALQRVAPTGALVGTPIAIPVTGEHCCPRVAFDGNNYLAVWAQGTQTNDSLYGQFVSPSGALVGSPFLVVGSGPGTYEEFVIGFGGGTYLVAYRISDAGGLRARLISPSGTVGSEFFLSASGGFQAFNTIAFDGTNFMVVWGAHDSGLKGTFVSPAGSVGATVTIRGAGPSGELAVPDVAFNGTNYFVVWSDSVGPGPYDYDVFAQVVSPAGQLVGGPITVSSGPGMQWIPSVAGDGRGGSLVAWVDRWEDPQAVTLRGRWYDATGTAGSEQTLAGVSADGRVPFGFLGSFGAARFLLLINRGTPGVDPLDLDGYSNWDLFGAFVIR